MSNELKPCPFCGGEATFAAHATAEEMDYGIICRTMAVIGCDACEFCMSGETDEETVAKWNARAAVTDEQFATAVHDGRVWRVVRECRMSPARGVGWYCSECSVWVAPGPMANATEYLAPRYCPNCGAKVVV